MVKLLTLIEKYLRGRILDSFLAQTVPGTRFIVSMMISLSIFINDYTALGVFTGIIFLLIICSLETLKENLPIVIYPILVGILFGLGAWFRPDWMQAMGVSPILVLWKFFVLTLSAAVFMILLPQKDIILLLRKLRRPQWLAATIALFRSVEIGGWAWQIVNRTHRTKRLGIIRNPTVWFDSLLTGVYGHFLDFLDGFEIALRTRGLESNYFMPRDGLKAVSSLDVLVIVLCVVALVALIPWR